MKALSRVRLLATPCTAAYQAPPSMGFSRQKYWSGVPLSLSRVQLFCDAMNCSPPGSSVYGDSPSKNTGVGCHPLLQGIFPTQGSNPGLPHCRWILYCLSHQGSPSRILLTLRYLITSLKAGMKRIFHTKTNPSYSNCNLKKFV